MAVLGYLSKLKMVLGLVFGVDVLHDFSIKCSLGNTLSIDKVSMSHLHSQDIKQNVLLSSYLDN